MTSDAGSTSRYVVPFTDALNMACRTGSRGQKDVELVCSCDSLTLQALMLEHGFHGALLTVVQTFSIFREIQTPG